MHKIYINLCKRRTELLLWGSFWFTTIDGMSKKTTQNLTNASSLVLLKEMPTGGGSDITLKKDIANLPVSLDKVLKLRPVMWQWKNKRVGEDREYGFIAQEVEEIIPELVSIDTWIDGSKRKFLSTEKMVPFIVAAIQEQQLEIDKLKAKLEQLGS